MLAEAKSGALAARIAGLTFDRAGWTAPAREASLARLTAMGLPGRRDEYWRYTDPTTLNAADPVPAALFDPGAEAPALEGIDRLKLVFVDGVFDPAQSDDPAMAGVEIERLAIASRADILREAV
jgi:Fe-S cluster assembly protein SufD